MKLIILAALFACAYAARVSGDVSDIIRQDSEVNPDGSYSYSYETGNGISAEEHGVPAGEGLAVSGAYKYQGEDGVNVDLTYTADENGFHPAGSHLPQDHEVPEYIVRAIKYNEAHPYVEPELQGARRQG